MTNLDETELARLEALAGKASKGPFVSDKNNQVFRGDGNPFAFAYAVGFPTCDIQPDNCAYIAAACNAVPALVAEVRRLRDKVEAWEWFGECFDNCKQRGKLPLEVHKTPSAYSEAWASLWAAREAVHADRE